MSEQEQEIKVHVDQAVKKMSVESEVILHLQSKIVDLEIDLQIHKEMRKQASLQAKEYYNETLDLKDKIKYFQALQQLYPLFYLAIAIATWIAIISLRSLLR